MINDIDIQEFDVTSGVPQGCSLSGAFFNIAMIPFLAKLNCLPTKGGIRPYQIRAEAFLTKKGTLVLRNIASANADEIISTLNLILQKDDPKLIINEILGIYSKFSKVCG